MRAKRLSRLQRPVWIDMAVFGVLVFAVLFTAIILAPVWSGIGNP